MSDKVYQVITDQMIAALEAGTVPWQKPWSVKGVPAINGKSGKPYRGINPFILALSAHASPVWLTFKQVKELGGDVIPGSKGLPVTFWKRFEVADETKKSGKRNIMMIRYYTVFNLDQTANVKLPKPVQKRLDEAAAAMPNVAQSIDEAEALLATYLGSDNAPKYAEVPGNDRAFYVPAEDRIAMPVRESFKSSEEYYSTAFHECGHSTGHESRLNRRSGEKSHAFGSEAYSEEELVAEMASAFLCAEAGLDTSATFKNSAAYVANWLNALKGDNKLVVAAAGKAQKAADLILGKTWESAES